MLHFNASKIKSLAIHTVGNPSMDEPLILNQQLVELSENEHDIVLEMLMQGFSSHEKFGSEEAELTPVYQFCLAFLEREYPNADFNLKSQKIAEHLYGVMTHPKTNPGHLFIAHVVDTTIDGFNRDAMVFIKSEIEKTVIELKWNESDLALKYHSGIIPGQIEKGAMAYFNSNDELEFLLIEKSRAAINEWYWSEYFLEVKPVKNGYFKTKQAIEIAKGFIEQELPEITELQRTEAARIKQQAEKYFRTKDEFQIDGFSEALFHNKDLQDGFKTYANEFEDSSITEDFDISKEAAKKAKTTFKEVIKLDKNFHIYIHGNTDLIQQGYDDQKGMNYYKVYFSNQN
jgi:hypothetical protein